MKKVSALHALRTVAALLLLVFAASAFAANYEVFVGTYTDKQQSKGIYAFDFDPATGKVGTPHLAVETKNPSFLAIDNKGRFLYAVNEVGDYKGAPAGAVSVFGIQKTGKSGTKLTELQQVSSKGADPAYLTLDKSGRDLLVANYTGGNLIVFPVLPDGKLGEHSSFIQHTGNSVNKERQEGPHAHSIQMANDNRIALSADLGLDQILSYRFDPAKGTLTLTDQKFAKVAPGAGPRHVAFAPDGRFVYVTNEMSSTVTAFTYDANTGAMSEIQTVSTLGEGDEVPGNNTAEIAVDSKGRNLYVSNRGDDSIAHFTINPHSGRLMFIDSTKTGGKTPRFFTLDPTGRWLFAANQDSNDIFLFKVDQKTGNLIPTGTRIEVGAPVCLVFMKQ